VIVNILLFLLWFLVWLLLSWPLDARDLITGIFVSLFVSLMTNDMFRPHRLFRGPARYLWFIYYLCVFFVECIKANLDVAYRVVHPDIPIRPGTLRVKTALRSDAGLTFLANSITLTPGTTTVDIDREAGYIYVHMLWVGTDSERIAGRLAIVEKFENILKRIFE
jgi:multicomponent Na+:H+ antiporter subunit E